MRTYLYCFLFSALVVLQTGCSSESISNEENLPSETNQTFSFHSTNANTSINSMFMKATGHNIEHTHKSGVVFSSRLANVFMNCLLDPAIQQAIIDNREMNRSFKGYPIL